jgi:hypothetical protein
VVRRGHAAEQPGFALGPMQLIGHAVGFREAGLHWAFMRKQIVVTTQTFVLHIGPQPGETGMVDTGDVPQ